MNHVEVGKHTSIALLFLVIALLCATLLMAQPSPEVSLSLVIPNGGEIWSGQQVILWNSSDIERVDIWFSEDNGSQWIRLAQDIDSLGSFLHQWEWDTTQVNDTTIALINISSLSGYGHNDTLGSGYGGLFNPHLYYDTSNTTFILDNTPPEMTNISAQPLIQEAGDNISLSATIWDTHAGIDNVTLSLQFPDSHWENIPLSLNQSNNTYSYTRSYITVGLYNYSFLAIDYAGNLYHSPWHSFAITDTIPPDIELLFPLGGEVFSGEVTIHYNITDNSDANFNEHISIEYSPDGGSTWILVADELYNTGTYDWNTTHLHDGKNYYLRINATDQGENQGSAQTPAPFTLDNTPPTILLTAPSGGSILPDLISIAWEAWDLISPRTNITIDILYSSDNGENWTFLIQNISNTGLYVQNTQHWNDSKTILFQITATDEIGNTGQVISNPPLIKDAHPPQVTIARPHEGWLHFRDEQIIFLPGFLKLTLVIGRFTVQIDAFDSFNITGIGRIDISVDHIIQESLWEKPYEWEWHGTFGEHILTATAYDYAGNYATTSQNIFVIALPQEIDTTEDSF